MAPFENLEIKLGVSGVISVRQRGLKHLIERSRLSPYGMKFICRDSAVVPSSVIENYYTADKFNSCYTEIVVVEQNIYYTIHFECLF